MEFWSERVDPAEHLELRRFSYSVWKRWISDLDLTLRRMKCNVNGLVHELCGETSIMQIFAQQKKNGIAYEKTRLVYGCKKDSHEHNSKWKRKSRRYGKASIEPG